MVISKFYYNNRDRPMELENSYFQTPWKKLENVRIKMHELHSPDNFAILHLLHVSFRLISIFL